MFAIGAGFAVREKSVGEFDDETLTLLWLLVTELTDVLLPAVTDWRMHRTVVLFQPSPDCCSVTHAGSASPGVVD